MGRFFDWLLGPEAAPSEVRGEGSVGSAGGDSPLPGILPPPREDVLTTRSALSLPTVYRCISIIATAVSQLPLDVWRWDEPIEVSSRNNNAWLKRPDLNVSQARFLERTAVSLATAGNAYWRIYRTSPTDPINAVEVWNPHNVLVEREDSGRIVYWYEGKKYQDWQVSHLSLLDVPGSLTGLGPIQAAQQAIRGAMDLSSYSDNWFRTGGVPNAILSAKQALTPEQAAQYKAAFEATQANGRGVAVLGSETSYQPVWLKPADAQFLESQNFSTLQLARLFGVPASKLLVGVEGNSMTYANTEQLGIEFYRDTLTQYLVEIENALTDLLPRGQVAKFNLNAFLRSDTKTRYEAHQIALSARFLTVNEVRALEGLPPVPGGDQMTEPPAPPTAPDQNEQEEPTDE